MEKELAKFAQNKALQEAVRLAFEAELEEKIISRVMGGEDVIGYREARDIMRNTIKRIVGEHSLPVVRPESSKY